MTPLTSVLIVDDEPAVRQIMSRWVTALGLNARTAADADEALATLKNEHCDLAVVDIMMPGHDGLWLANELKREHPHTAIVLATAYTSLLEGDQAPPVADLLIKPFARQRFVLAVDRGRQWRKEALEEVRWHARLSVDLRERTASVREEIERLAEHHVNESELLEAMAEARTPDVVAHSERVARYTVSIARAMGVPGDEVTTFETAARFHDVGKMLMPDSLLNKPSPLTPGEQALMRRHVDAGAEILSSTRTLSHVAPIVMASHEWFDGGGYPRKLSRDAICLASRVIAVADAYDAMTQDRQYRVKMGSAEAVAELLRCSGSQFDPAVVTALLGILGTH